MIDLFDNPEMEKLDLADADLRFWQQIDLGVSEQVLLQELIDNTDWRQQQITVFGQQHLQPRLSAWFGDCAYSYSGIRLEPNPWTTTLLNIKASVEALCQHDFNTVLLNYYRNQDDSMGMHSDDERELGPKPVIASLSLGEERVFTLKHKSRKDLKTVKLPLPSSSLLLMQGNTQRFWKHGIARLAQPRGPRINLTFRKVYPQQGSASR